MADKPVEKTDGTPVAMTVEQLRDLIAGVASAQNPGITPDALREILSGTMAASADAMRHKLDPENKDWNEISCFTHPEGERVHPKAKLRRKTYFCYALQREETLTPAEIDAYNAIARSCTAQDGRWTATVQRDGTEEKLHVFVPNKHIDDRMGLPSLLMILRELKDGPAAVDTERMAERLMQVESELAAMKATTREPALAGARGR